jgi:uncharacterized protein (TIGR00251 family)
MTAAAGPPYEITAAGLTLRVRATPRAAKTAVEGVRSEPDGRCVLRVRVAAPPVDGAANAALVEWLAKALGVRRSDVEVAAGESGRSKRVTLAGDGAAIAAKLEALIAATKKGRSP